MAKKAVMMCILALLFPYIMTLSWTGKVAEQKKMPVITSGKEIVLDKTGGNASIDVEEYLPGVVAKQMPITYGKEALKAQAMIARTFIYRKMEEQNEIKESELYMDYMNEKEMEKEWGSASFIDHYQAVEDAVSATAKTVMTYDGKLIEPLFHRASTGKTRTGDEKHAYLQSVDCKKDVEAEGYLTMIIFSKKEFADKINQLTGETTIKADDIPESIQIILRDEGGYVEQIQIGTRVFAGEEVQYALGFPSPAYSFEEYEGKIRVVCQGIGHGYGMSQYEAKCKSDEGWTAEQILSYFYKNISIISE